MRHVIQLALFLVAGCATLSKDTSVCPEYRNLRCASGTVCSMDQTRGCRVCQCDAGDVQLRPVETSPPPVE